MVVGLIAWHSTYQVQYTHFTGPYTINYTHKDFEQDQDTKFPLTVFLSLSNHTRRNYAHIAFVVIKYIQLKPLPTHEMLCGLHKTCLKTI